MYVLCACGLDNVGWCVCTRRRSLHAHTEVYMYVLSHETYMLV